MLFNSFEFIYLFLPLSVAGFLLLRRSGKHSGVLNWLLLCSLVFYAAWDLRFVPMLLGSIILNHAAAHLMIKQRSWSTPILLASIGLNLALLGYFKYSGFLLTQLGWASSAPQVLLPLGISFYTFQQISYLVDCHSRPETTLGLRDYGLFVTFFPQLVAGPILHQSELIPQLRAQENTPKAPDWSRPGLRLLSIGVFKKVVIADTLGWATSSNLDSSATLGFLEAWTQALAFTLQLYFDFGGYCDMALGMGLLFGVRLPVNFRHPYRALDIGEFWKRWHITLTRWFENYLYYPLAIRVLRSSSSTVIVVLLNLLIFTLIGLWHGASWGFVVFGLLHGLAISTHKIWQRIGKPLPALLAWPLLFIFLNFTWVFFHSPTLSAALVQCRAMLGLKGISTIAMFETGLEQLQTWTTNPLALAHLPRELSLLLSLLVSLLCLVWILSPRGADPDVTDDTSLHVLSPARWSWATALLLGLSLFVLSLREHQPFLYFNF